MLAVIGIINWVFDFYPPVSRAFLEFIMNTADDKKFDDHGQYIESIDKQEKIYDNEYIMKIIADDSVRNYKMGHDFELLPL